ncbi:hypothetical protein IEU95_03895 [Hoyosella rhizosphaerae]|uniref:Condensation domain-containing protein n=1 Tax=Hoyosella rhizosphaerae TaxID=1755582 RepID=A0A916UD43_9ACTN|nr:condensation domain-containing protein [Hoyosella rhizosphaerae]MBN4925956.1 hypothetical protein [Hoyosella rhizosphaerae]GGC66643.1 hypothetical protein GCM10011410_19090 [Hoyosella rhizosphaerae]
MNDAPRDKKSADQQSKTAADRGPMRVHGDKRAARVPLSLAEQRLWLINRFDPTNPVHNIPVSVELIGALNIGALGRALSDVLTRHEMLRTLFPASADGPYQVSVPAAEVTADATPVKIGITEDPLDAIERFVEAGFDLTREIPFRVRVFELGPDEYILTIVVHHIAVDRTSMKQLIGDLLHAYESRCADRAPCWTELTVQYSDYALWQREILGEEADPTSVTAQEIAFWRAELAGAADVLDLPLDHPRPEFQSLHGKPVDFYLSASTHASVRALAESQGVSVFSVMQSVLTILLSKLCGTDDVIIGTTVDTRVNDSLAPIVGMFGNTIALRNRMVDTESFADLLARVHERSTDAFTNAETPFERLLDVLAVKRSTSHHPVFQVSLSVHPDNEYSVTIDDLDIAIGTLEVKSADCDLEFVLTETVDADGAGAGIACSLVYAVDLFDESTVVGIVQRFQTLLNALVADTDTPICDINVLTERERGLLLPQRSILHRSLDRALRVGSPRPHSALPSGRRSDSSIGSVVGEVSTRVATTKAAAGDLALALLSYAAGKMDSSSAQNLADSVMPDAKRHKVREITA